MKPLDKVIWWIEYTIRHDGAYHFRSAYSEIPFWKYFMIDQIAAALLVLIMIIYVLAEMMTLGYTIVKQQIQIKTKIE